ncbi:MAG: hypothetical protein V3V59_08120 [Thermodesulfovibrionales bacterium]
MKREFWIVVIIVAAFFGFMMGYALPPFMEVGFGTADQAVEGTAVSEEDMMKQYEELYQEEEPGSSSE